MKKPKIAIVGATGLVGRTMLKVLHERNFPFDEILLFASERSDGEKIEYKGNTYFVKILDGTSFDGVDIALFSAGKATSLKYAPIAEEKKCIVIDNSSAWRMNPEVPLIVPEVNPEEIDNHKGIIANPNCSTIQLVVALKPIHDKYILKRVIVSTYQSISGAGQKGLDKLNREIAGQIDEHSHPIAFNTSFHEFEGNDGFTIEEIKMINETRKILKLPQLKIAITCVRLPILGGHGESVNIETEKPFEPEELRELFRNQKGIVLIDNPQAEEYPTTALAKDTDPVYIGRIRRDSSVENGAYIWLVADNVRKGAATNAVQIAELII